MRRKRFEYEDKRLGYHLPPQHTYHSICATVCTPFRITDNIIYLYCIVHVPHFMTAETRFTKHALLFTGRSREGLGRWFGGIGRFAIRDTLVERGGWTNGINYTNLGGFCYPRKLVLRGRSGRRARDLQGERRRMQHRAVGEDVIDVEKVKF